MPATGILDAQVSGGSGNTASSPREFGLVEDRRTQIQRVEMLFALVKNSSEHD
jgi:hypothetical protein